MAIFGEMNKTTRGIPLKYKSIELSDTFTIKQLQVVLDSNKQNIVICGTINETFGIRLVKTLQSNKKYSAIAIGMPTWDGIKEFNKLSMDEKLKGVEIIYSTPYNFSKTDNLGKLLVEQYKDKFYARASDWFFKGYETMYYFTNTLLKYNADFMKHLSESDYRLFNAFDIQPVAGKEASTPNYLENKKLYFIKKQDGLVKSIN
jgi:hypothetical protein